MRNAFSIMIALSLLTGFVSAQTSEEQAFREVINSVADTAKLGAIDRFSDSYPKSVRLGEVYGMRFSVLLSLHRDSAAFYSVHQYFASRESVYLPSALHLAALDLSYRRRYSDSALTYIDSALTLLQRYRGRLEAAYLQTKAFVLSNVNRYADAESTQREAVRLLPTGAENDPRYANFFYQLATIETHTASRDEGIQGLVRLSLRIPGRSALVPVIDSLLANGQADSSAVASRRDSLYRIELSAFLRTINDTTLGKGVAALSLSRLHLLQAEAERLAREAYDDARKGRIEDREGSTATLGIVLFNAGKEAGAEPYLEEAVKYATPFETELFSALGMTQEYLGKKEEAFHTYLTAATGYRAPQILERLKALNNELHPAADIDSLIEAAQDSLSDFEVERYTPPKTRNVASQGRTVLAELFTGTECRPCVAADIAFDKLAERYPTQSLAVVEYHLHVPRPDPLANGDAEERASFYDVSSSPTAIINGDFSVTSGGSTISAHNRFLTYADAIEAALASPPKATIGLSAMLRSGRLRVTATATVRKPLRSYRLRVALLEDSVYSAGGNGITLHAFVVRKFIKSSVGTAFRRRSKVMVQEIISLQDLSDRLSTYLDEYEEIHRHSGVSFRDKNTAINPHHLSVVAFVQDDETREVLQAKIISVR